MLRSWQGIIVVRELESSRTTGMADLGEVAGLAEVDYCSGEGCGLLGLGTPCERSLFLACLL